MTMDLTACEVNLTEAAGFIPVASGIIGTSLVSSVMLKTHSAQITLKGLNSKK